MHAATKRAVIAAAGLAAAGLLGSLPYDGSPLAQQGAPVQHHDVALVDVTDSTTILNTETNFDDSVYSYVFGDSASTPPVVGAEAELYNSAVSALGTPDADALLGTTVGAQGIFDGSATNATDGLLFDTWAGENELNTLLGISNTTSETAILTDIDSEGLGSVAGLPTDTDSASVFDTDLMSIATGDFTTASTEFTTYLDSLPTAVSDLGGLSTLLGDVGLGSLGDGVGSLGTDLTSLLDGLLGSL